LLRCGIFLRQWRKIDRTPGSNGAAKQNRRRMPAAVMA
jgi:hypothetical protein